MPTENHKIRNLTLIGCGVTFVATYIAGNIDPNIGNAIFGKGMVSWANNILLAIGSTFIPAVTGCITYGCQYCKEYARRKEGNHYFPMGMSTDGQTVGPTVSSGSTMSNTNGDKVISIKSMTSANVGQDQENKSDEGYIEYTPSPHTSICTAASINSAKANINSSTANIITTTSSVSVPVQTPTRNPVSPKKPQTQSKYKVISPSDNSIDQMLFNSLKTNPDTKASHSSVSDFYSVSGEQNVNYGYGSGST
jgi:hypothetical protein